MSAVSDHLLVLCLQSLTISCYKSAVSLTIYCSMSAVSDH
ncbi:unnamed protein product, partial [Staurois parvus]